MIPLLLLMLLALIMLRVPVLVAVAAAGLTGMIVSANATPAFFAQRSFAAIDSFSLLALPYFILAGAIMTRGGLSQALVALFQSVFGRVRGSLGHATVGACVGMANVSGSSAAEAAAIGSVTIPAMKDEGYRPGLAAAIVAASATIGPIIPPSMTMIIYGSIAGVSIGGLFLAGIVPGLLMALALSTCLYALSFHPAFPELRGRTRTVGLRAFAGALRESWIALLAPVIILGGIFSGVFTATEAGIVTCVYAFAASWLFYGGIDFRTLRAVFVDAAITTAVVVGIIAMAGSLGWLMAFDQFDHAVLDTIRGISDNPLAVLAMLVLTMLVLTMFVESLAVLIVFIPTIVLVGTDYGFDPLHLGVIVVIATQLGALTPPVAVLLFVTSRIAKTPVEASFRYVWPFLLALVAVLVLVATVPQVATTVPTLARGAG